MLMFPAKGIVFFGVSAWALWLLVKGYSPSSIAGKVVTWAVVGMVLMWV